MFYTDKNELKRFDMENRIWQGIPGIEVTDRGRVFLTFYSGGTKEEIGNFAVLLRSDDGVTFSEPIAAAYLAGHRCYDPCLWIDPLGRLWFTFAVAPDNAVYAVVCDNPDAEVLHWGPVRKIGNDVMMNKPIVLQNGEWLFPIAVWGKQVCAGGTRGTDEDRKAFAYLSNDDGASFRRLGGVDAPGRSFDEHMLLELGEDTLAMYIRTHYGIGVAHSYDNGRTWTEATDSGLQGPDSRFHIRRLQSGRILLLNHHHFFGRNNLTAMLSEDNGKTFPYRLLLDERSDVSYPDAKQTADGRIWITYDRERGAFRDTLDEAYACAREILLACVTEEDILAGELRSSGSRLKVVATRLGKYRGEAENPYHEIRRYSEEELTEHLLHKSTEEILDTLFERYEINCMNLYRIDSQRLDRCIEAMKNGAGDRREIVSQMVQILRSADGTPREDTALVARVKTYIEAHLGENRPLQEMAQDLNMSKYYLCHEFKKATNMTLTEWKNYLRIEKAKKLLVGTECKVIDIALECGFENASYFSETFRNSEKIQPEAYRTLLRSTRLAEKDAVLKSLLPPCALLGTDLARIGKSNRVRTHFVARPTEEFAFLHEAAITAFHGRLFAAWYNNRKIELHGYTPIRFSVSEDDGATWSEPVTIVGDRSEKILYCPPVFAVDGDTLYLFLNQMVAPDHIHALDLYVYNEKENRFELRWSRPIPFKLNTNVYKMSNGKWILPGRLAELDGFPQVPAVMIADSGHPDGPWRTVKLQQDKMLPDGSEFVHPEVSLLVQENRICAFCRNDQRNVPIVFLSEDYGESWQGPFASDIPFSSAKIYSGTLQDGREYVIGNIGPNRQKLYILFRKAGSRYFDSGVLLQDGYSEEWGTGYQWTYPCACEDAGKLYIMYTVVLNPDNARGAMLSVLDLKETAED